MMSGYALAGSSLAHLVVIQHLHDFDASLLAWVLDFLDIGCSLSCSLALVLSEIPECGLALLLLDLDIFGFELGL